MAADRHREFSKFGIHLAWPI